MIPRLGFLDLLQMRLELFLRSEGRAVDALETLVRLVSERARNRIALLKKEVEDYYGSFRVTTDLIELRNLLQAAELIVDSALRRTESRGLHYTLDYPETDEVAKDTVLVP